MSQTTLRRTALPFSLLSIAIIVLALITASIHLDRAIMMGFFGGHAGGPPAGGAHAGGPPGGVRPFRAGGPSGPLAMVFQILPLLFFLNFVAYLVLIIALYLPPLKRIQPIIRWVLIAFAALTIVAYFTISGFHTNITGYTDKIIEVALIVLLLIESRKATHPAQG